jgi:hypothetical protein
MTEDAWVVAARSVEKMRTEIAELQAKNEALHAHLEGSQFSRAVIANLRAALSRIVAAIPGRGPIPDVIDGPWTDSIVASVLSVEVRLHDKIARLHDKIAELRKECGQHAMISMELREKLLTGEVSISTFGNDKHLYVKIADVLKWHENEIQYARTSQRRKLQEQVIERCKDAMQLADAEEDDSWADVLRDALDPIWRALSDEDREALNARGNIPAPAGPRAPIHNADGTVTVFAFDPATKEKP